MKEEEKEIREREGLFKFGVISPLLSERIPKGKLSTRMKELAQKVYEHPHYGFREYSWRTIEEWYYQFRADGFDRLLRISRSDRGKSRVISEELGKKLTILKLSYPSYSVPMLIQTLVLKGEIGPGDLQESTVIRYLKNKGILYPEEENKKLKGSEKEKKKWQAVLINEIWQVDTLHGPIITGEAGKPQRTFLIAILDDFSRYLIHGQFHFADDHIHLEDTLKTAILKKGLCQKLVMDNGANYQSYYFKLLLARLSIVPCYCAPYSAWQKGKIERFLGTCRRRMLSALDLSKIYSLKDLNDRFASWVALDYNQKVHHSLGRSPRDVYMEQADRIRWVKDPEALEVLFYHREFRKVREDGTILLHRTFYEVPQEYVKKKIEVRFNPRDMGRIFIFEHDKKVATAYPVDPLLNAHLRRQRRKKNKVVAEKKYSASLVEEYYRKFYHK